MLEGPPGMRLQTTAVGALISMQRSWYNRLALRRCSGLSLLSASLQRCAACISSPGTFSPTTTFILSHCACSCLPEDNAYYTKFVLAYCDHKL